MLNHTYTSVKNANLVDCGKKQHIPSQPFPLLKDNFLGEFRTELDKKKVLANLGIASDLSLEWEYIKGDIGSNKALMDELDSRTKYVSNIDGFKKSIIEGVHYLESVIGGDLETEAQQNERIKSLEESSKTLVESLEELQKYLSETIEIDIDSLQNDLKEITEKVNNITALIQVSNKEGNALVILTEDSLEEGETPGLYVPDLSKEIAQATEDIKTINQNVTVIQDSLDGFVTKEELGGDDFNFVSQNDFDQYTEDIDEEITAIKEDLTNTVKTGKDGHVDTLYVNKISKSNDDGIKISNSFDVESGIPLDVRFVKEDLEELYNIPVQVCYPGMGVIVNSLSALYILRKPQTEVEFTQDYIANPNSWKCPEDLVTVAITRYDYDHLEEINPNVFYYIYEEEIVRTREPNRSSFPTEEAFNEAWQQWVDSLKVLSQEYMSAAWGVDIERKLSEKASNSSVIQLSDDIKALQGGEDGVSLKTLNTDVENLKAADEVIKNDLQDILTNVDGEESGRLITAENDIKEIQNKLENYVSKDYIQDESNNFIFVKNSTYQEDKLTLENSLKTQITTEQITAGEVKTDKFVLNESTLVVNDSKLIIDESTLATTDEIPKILVLTQDEYDALEQKNSETYYYTFDSNEVYVTKAVLDATVKTLRDQINSLHEAITLLEQRIPSQEQD